MFNKTSKIIPSGLGVVTVTEYGLNIIISVKYCVIFDFSIFIGLNCNGCAVNFTF